LGGQGIPFVFSSGATQETGWETHQSPHKDTLTEVRDVKVARGERSITTGRAKGLVDCSAEEAIAWYFDYCR